MNRQIETTTQRGSYYSIETHLTDAEALESLERRENEGALDRLPSSLLTQHRSGHSLSEAQMFWVHYFALKKDQEGRVEPIDVSPILKLFPANAKRAKIAFDKLAALPQGIKFTLTTSRSKVPGSINVASRSGRWYGRIVDGQFQPSRNCDDDVINFLKLFAATPDTMVTTYGRSSGYCCFCGIELTTDESKFAGYGPVCAKQRNLEWGQVQ